LLDDLKQFHPQQKAFTFTATVFVLLLALRSGM